MAITGPDYGTAGLISGLGGLAQGINQGLITYQNQQNIKYNQKMEEALTGMQRNDDGSFTPTPAKQQAMQLQSQLQTRQLHEMDPSSQESQTARQVSRGLMQNIPGFKGDVSQLIPDNASAADLKENNPLEKATMAGMYGMLGQQARGNAMQGMVDVRKQQFGETQNQNAIKVGHDYDADPIIKNSKVKLNAMKQSGAILDNPNKPVTANDFAAAYQDYLNGTAPGGQPTEGKATREIPDTFEQKWNALKGKFGQFDDMRQDADGAQLISLLNENRKSSMNELGQQIGSEAGIVHQNYAQSTNPKVRATDDAKYKQYTGGLIQSGQNQRSGAAQDPKITQYAQQNGLDYAHAAQILKARGYNGQQ